MMRLSFLVCIAFLTVNAHAVEKRYVDSWSSKLATTSQLLKDGAYAQALTILKDVTDEMFRVLGPGDATTYVLSIPLIQIALAEAGLGDRRAALWHWHMAQTLYPKTADSDLSMFGEPGEFLKKNLLSNPTPEKCAPRPEGMTPPKVSKTIEPLYPEGARKFRERGIVIVDLKIGVDGVPSEPRVVKPLSAPLTYAALGALRSWTFTPAMLDGKPIESSFCITVNFKLR